jgi:hypothetical protein
MHWMFFYRQKEDVSQKGCTKSIPTTILIDQSMHSSSIVV